MRKYFLLSVLLALKISSSLAQCLIPSPEGDTVFPVINRMNTPSPWGGGYDLADMDRRKPIYQTTSSGNTLYIGGDFQFIGQNTGCGVMMNEQGTQILSAKKWRINGAVHASVADGSGGYFIAGIFTKVGDSTRNNIAHINGSGVPTAWNPGTNDLVKTLALFNDTLLVGGKFSKINGQTRNGFAMLNVATGQPLAPINLMNGLYEGTVINAFRLVDTFLYVGGNYDNDNIVKSFFRLNLRSGGWSNYSSLYQMEEIYTIDVSADKRRVYIGGWAGSTTNSNGFCVDANTAALIYRIDVGVLNYSGRGMIRHLAVHGKNVYAAGLFNYGYINGNSFNQKGIVVFDTTSGQIRPILNDCEGFVTSVHPRNGKIFLGGEFSSIAGKMRDNFAVYDTTLNTVDTTTLPFSDQLRTISFNGSQMFVGGYFQSISCVRRPGFAAFDINTGEIKPWVPNIYAVELGDMIARGDTIFMAGKFGQAGNPFSLGGFVAVNATTGTYYSAGLSLQPRALSLLLDGDYIYVGGNGRILKVYIPTLQNVSGWNPSIGFHVRSVQKRNGKVYGVGDLHDTNVDLAYLAEVNDNTGVMIRTILLNPPPNSQNDFGWISDGVLAGNKFFFTGSFKKVLQKERKNLAVFDVDNWRLDTTINVRIEDAPTYNELILKDGNVLVSGSFTVVNGKAHNYFAVIDTTVGAVFPDRMKFNDDSPNGYSLDDYENYERLNTFLIHDDHLIVGGNFRNVNKGMFPSLAKLKFGTGSAPVMPSGIAGPDTINCPSQNNIFSIVNPDPDNRYAWYSSGEGITIKNNGTDSVLIDVSPLAVPGILKAIALTECGRSDTIYRPFYFKTIEPTVPASNIQLVRKTDTTATVRFTRGNGTRRLVVVRAVSPVDSFPQDGLEYTGNINFGSGSGLGGNTFVVYMGNNDSAAIRNLDPSTVYHVAVFEFNGVGDNTNYLTSSFPSFSFSTLASRPTVQASNVVATNVTQNSFTVNCTPGNGSGTLMVIRMAPSYWPALPVDGNSYTASSVYGTGSDLGGGNYVIATTASTITVTNLQAGSMFYVTAFSFNGNGDSASYLTAGHPEKIVRTMAIEPTVPASNIVLSNITATSCTINCTPGNGQYRLVVMRQGQAVVDVPQDSIFYGWGSSNITFGTGQDIGNQTYVLNAATPVTVNGLTPGTEYHIAIFEFNGSLWNNNYLTTGALASSFTTSIAPPTLPANNISASNVAATTATLTCNSGNGSSRLFVIRAGAAVTNNPVNGTDYNSDPVFGQGSDLGNNSYAVAESQPVTVTNLTPGTTYHVKVFEFNGTGTNTRYLLGGAPGFSFTTAGLATEPGTQASNITLSGVTENSVTINCSPGNGAQRMVVIRAGNSLTTQPQDGMAYSANTVFGSGSDIGAQTFVVSVTGTPVTITGLPANSEFVISIFEFNGSGTTINYLSSNNPLLNFRTLATEPTSQASSPVFSGISENSVTINCSPGNGSQRLVVIKAGTSSSSQPVDGNSYAVNPVFGSGADIGGQTFVVSNTGTNVTVTGLQPNTDYTVTIFELNGNTTSTNYLLAGAPSAGFRSAVVTGIINLGLQGVSLKIAPNPLVDDRLQIYMETTVPAELVLEIFTIEGMKILEKSWQMNSGANHRVLVLPANLPRASLVLRFAFRKKTGSLILIRN